MKSKLKVSSEEKSISGKESRKSLCEARRHVSIAYDDIQKSFSLRTVADWSQIVSWLLPHLRPGSILALSGPLGAGKTTFAQRLADRLGIKRHIQSPTFTLLRTYHMPRAVHGIRRLIHVDMYRMEDEQDAITLNLDEELLDGHSMLIIEWAEHFHTFLKNHPQHISMNIDVVEA